MPPPASPAQQAAAPAQIPLGQSPAVQATPNRGLEAAAGQRLGVVVNLMAMMLPQLGVNTPMGQDLMKAMQMLSKHVPPGSVSPASQQNEMQNLGIRNAQQNSQLQAMRQRQMQQAAGGGGPGGGGGPPGGGEAEAA